MNRYKFESNAGRAIRNGHGVEYSNIGSIQQSAYGDELYTFESFGLYALVGDVWLRTILPKEGWTAVIHRGVEQGKLTDLSIEPPPVDPNDVKRIIKAIVEYETESGETKSVECYPSEG